MNKTTMNASGAEKALPSPLPASLEPYNVSPNAYLAAHPTITDLVVSAAIVNNSRVLLIQRAAHDGFPLKWECAGGQVDSTDKSILHATCREAYEETGLLVASGLVDVIDTLEFDGKEGGRWRKITFLAVLSDRETPVVQLDAEEHQDAVWATEREVIAEKCEGREIVFAYPEQKVLVLDVLRRTACGTTPQWA